MSRSYKKFPAVRAYYGESGKKSRNYANRKIRRLPLDYDLPNGRGFKKLSESCDIWDYSFTQFKEWEIKEWEQEEARRANGLSSWKHRLHSTLDEALNDWAKFYKRK
jgi:hypothetical protein